MGNIVSLLYYLECKYTDAISCFYRKDPSIMRLVGSWLGVRMEASQADFVPVTNYYAEPDNGKGAKAK